MYFFVISDKKYMSTDFDIVQFWQRIKDELKYKGLTQKELSTEIGKEPRLIETQIYNKFIPDIRETLELARVLDVSIEYLIFGIEKHPYKEKYKNLKNAVQNAINEN